MPRKPVPEVTVLHQVSFSKHYAMDVLGCPPEALLNELSMRKNDILTEFLVRNGIDMKITFEVHGWSASDWVYVVQRWSA